MFYLKELLFPHNHSRDNRDTSEDILLLLYLINKANNDISGEDILKAKIKLMKLVFLSELAMIDKKLKGFNFFFNLYTHGPSSKELLKLLDDLENRGLVDFNKSDFIFHISEKGKITVEDFISKENEDFFKIIDDTLKEYGKLTSDKIVETVYKMDIKPMYSEETINIGKAVKESPKKRLLMRLDKDEAKKELSVSDSWIETINFLMNPAFADSK